MGNKNIVGTMIVSLTVLICLYVASAQAAPAVSVEVLTNFAHITNGNILHFYASDDMGNSTEFDHSVTQAEMDAGGFVQNISIIIPDTTPPVITNVEPELTIVQPQAQFEVNITIDAGDVPVYSVEYYLHYNTSVVRAVTQNKGPFLGSDADTIVVINSIDHTTGIVSYAETRTIPGGVTGNGTLSTIHFMTIGERGDMGYLNLSGVIIVKDDLNETAYIVENGTVEISDNIPPTALGASKHGINNVAKKYLCNTTICACSYDENYPGKGSNITYVRWAFGDGEYGTSEGIHLNNCTCKVHKYKSWQWEPFGAPDGHYLPFTVNLTVRDDGCPEETTTTDFDVTVYIAGDANGDGRVNVLDASYVGRHWNQQCPTSHPSDNCYSYLWDEEEKDEADLNNDCDINILDAMIIGANWEYVAW